MIQRRIMENAVFRFQLDGNPVSCEPYGHGHINRTYLVESDQGKRYILQQLSRRAFHDIPGLMENVQAVTEFLDGQAKDRRESLHLVSTTDGGVCWLDENGEYWRCYEFIEGSICLQAARNEQDFYESAVAFGHFQRQLKDFPAHTLHETIPMFHNTPNRYRQLKEAIEKDVVGRAAAVREEIDFALQREEEGGRLQELLDHGVLPLRVTHNDTKLNNVMLDEETGKALCIIDLDTVMPGLVAYDVGDSIRFGASTAAEDEKDLSKVEMDLNLYGSYLKGFLSSCGELTKEEIRSLPLGAKIMTLENGVRFLTDYLDGDHYYATSREEHNLDRARTQFKLVLDMEKKWDDMMRIIETYL
ncbi:MAG: aminoglycoside phosphotransferase family protein [Lachnospiraceae bacterium]|nr:aminoglycoside phosphotransferase family protein [Lachnospiraceae bacterium]